MLEIKAPSIFSAEQFQHAINERLITVRKHPDEELYIANYTPKAVYDRQWNEVTLNCRGLIFNNTGEIVARPFRKFFNVGEVEIPLSPDAAVEVTDKADGSLAIAYPLSDGTYAIATRGSFTSDQALHATELLQSKYKWFKPQHNITYLFEVIFPSNKIVINYGEQDDIILLACIETKTGRTTRDGVMRWFGPHIERFPYRTFKEALDAAPRRNAEGLVVRFVDTDVRLKLKQADYVAAHRIVTNLSEKTVWENLLEHGNIDVLLETVPDEWHGWLKETSGSLLAEFGELNSKIHEEFDKIINSMPDFFIRKDFAIVAKESPYFANLFLLLDDNEMASNQMTWKRLKPSNKPVREDEE